MKGTGSREHGHYAFLPNTTAAPPLTDHSSCAHPAPRFSALLLPRLSPLSPLVRAQVMLIPEKRGLEPVRSAVMLGHEDDITCCALCNRSHAATPSTSALLNPPLLILTGYFPSRTTEPVSCYVVFFRMEASCACPEVMCGDLRDFF